MTTEAIERAVEHYMTKPYRIELVPDDDGWYVRIPDLPGCMSQGDTVEEAIEMIRDAQRGWLFVSLSHNDIIPEPSPLPSIWERGSTSAEPVEAAGMPASVAG